MISGNYIFLVGSFTAGLFAIAHCAVMCGPLLLLFRRHSITYQVGRVTGYTTVGLILGSVGQALDKAGYLVQLQDLSIYVALAILAILAVFMLLPSKVREHLTPQWIYLPGRWMAKLRRGSFLPLALAIFLAGMLSALLPCSVLFSVWALAAGSGSPLFGAAITLSFVLGTLPGLYLMQFVARRSESSFSILRSKPIQALSLAVLIVTGILMLAYRSNFSPRMDFESGGSIECLIPNFM